VKESLHFVVKVVEGAKALEMGDQQRDDANGEQGEVPNCARGARVAVQEQRDAQLDDREVVPTELRRERQAAAASNSSSVDNALGQGERISSELDGLAVAEGLAGVAPTLSPS